MSKDRIKKTLAALSVAGLLAGISLSAGGCTLFDGKSSCSSCSGKTAEEAKSSCGTGSCGAKAEEAKTSCGAGSCGAAE